MPGIGGMPAKRAVDNGPVSASKFSDAEVSMLWKVGLQSGLLGRVDEAELSKRLGVPLQRTRAIVRALIEIGFYDPKTQRMDVSKLPPMKWREFTSEEFDAHMRKICGDSNLT
jgi:transcription initiation factor IIE alpha subunit